MMSTYYCESCQTRHSKFSGCPQRFQPLNAAAGLDVCSDAHVTNICHQCGETRGLHKPSCLIPAALEQAVRDSRSRAETTCGIQRCPTHETGFTGASCPLCDDAAKVVRSPAARSVLPTDAKARKNAPIARGFLDYFPRAIAAVAELSRIANEQHNPGEPMHWSKDKSSDHADCLVRHLLERGTIDTDKQRHTTKVAWRAMALLEIELENAA